MARKLYRFAGLLMVLALGLGPVLWLGYGVGKGPATTGCTPSSLLVVGAIGYHHACRSLLRKFEEFANAAQRALVRDFNESRHAAVHGDRDPGGRQAVLSAEARMPRHRSSAVPLAWLYAALIVYASLYPFAGWRVPGLWSAGLPELALAALAGRVRPRSPTCSATCRSASLVFVAPVRSGRSGRAARHASRCVGADAAVVGDGAAAELPAAARLVERRPGCSTPPARRSASLSALLRRTARRHRRAGSGCANAGSSPAAPAAWRCCCCGRSACCSRRRCRSVWARCSAGCLLDAARETLGRRGPRAGPRAGPTPPRQPAQRGLSAPAEIAMIAWACSRHAWWPSRSPLPGWRRAARWCSARRCSASATTTLSTALNFGPQHALAWTHARRCRRSASALAAAALLSLRAAPRRRRLRPDRAHGAGRCWSAQAPADPYFAREPAGLGAGPLHPLPRRGAVGRLAVALRGPVLSAGAPGGARAEPLTEGRGAAQPFRPSSCKARRCVREPARRARAARSCGGARAPFADRHRGRAPTPAAMRAFWRRNSSLSSPPTRAKSGRCGAGRPPG